MGIVLSRHKRKPYDLDYVRMSKRQLEALMRALIVTDSTMTDSYLADAQWAHLRVQVDPSKKDVFEQMTGLTLSDPPVVRLNSVEIEQ